ncbi:hypothetical protein THAOC_23466 [Thalassiosira oceanica]|uniref:Uncharacterized protein n=1 Tax=Thalassiosira oceanica TaxID=159749 RepID=K0S6U7_THAOC|nr:hypothetical protein THAOC_23466 [Thalassiosira oceanica]|eukprot:EJK56611.1 hypothetical protein THAOC_23466 [Thalassiosira oceanica]
MNDMRWRGTAGGRLVSRDFSNPCVASSPSWSWVYNRTTGTARMCLYLGVIGVSALQFIARGCNNSSMYLREGQHLSKQWFLMRCYATTIFREYDYIEIA